MATEEEKLIEAETKRRETFSKGTTLGMKPIPPVNKEAEQGAPDIGWKKHLENIGNTFKKGITGKY